MSRDLSKALENIRKVIHEQDSQFRRESGLKPRDPKPAPKIQPLKPEPKTSQADSGVKLPADRFLETSIAQEPDPGIVEVIPQKDSRHSWLYNEVAKVVHDASGDNPNTKVVAVFVPVVQNGQELEDLPVHETVELSPVNAEDFSPEDEIDIQEGPAAAQEQDVPEEPAGETQPQDEHDDFFLNESEPESEPEPAPEPEPEPEQAEHLGELLPESIEHPDPELAEAFTTIEEKLDDTTAAPEEQSESDIDVTEDVTDDEDFSEGEKMPFTEIPHADENDKLSELVLPDELEDDEVVDDTDESGEDTNAN